MGMLLALTGRTPWTKLLANLTGIGLLVLVALVVGWFKGSPWRAARKSVLDTTTAIASPRPI